MSRVWAAVRSNPVRVWGYGVMLPTFGLLVGYGIVTEAQAAAWIGLGAGILAIPGTETVRSKVTPTVNLAKLERVAPDVGPEAADVIRRDLGEGV